MTGRDLIAVHDLAVDLSRWARNRIVGGRPGAGDPEEKSGPGDWVTSVDREVEAHIRAALLAAHPGDVVVGEEAGASGDPGTTSATDGLTWHVDPIDGTTNFVHGLPGVSVSIAASDADGPVVGIVHDVYRDEIFSAVRGKGAQVDGVSLPLAGSVSGLRGGLFLTEWSGTRPWSGMFDVITGLQDRFTATRVLGSCALSLASVAAGRATATVLGGAYNPWDVMAGALIAREAGCVIFDSSGPVDGVPLHGIGAAGSEVAVEVQRLWQACSSEKGAAP